MSGWPAPGCGAGVGSGVWNGFVPSGPGLGYDPLGGGEGIACGIICGNVDGSFGFCNDTVS